MRTKGKQSRSLETKKEATALVQVGNDGGCDQVPRRVIPAYILKAKQADVAYGLDLGDEQRRGVKDALGIVMRAA